MLTVRAAAWICAVAMCIPVTAAGQDAAADAPASLALDARADRAAMARALFERGVEHARREEFERAADLFIRAQSLRPAPGIAYNLASALARLGRLVEASEQLQWVVRQDDTTPEMRASAETTIAQLVPRLAHLRVVLDGPDDGVAITFDGAPLGRAVLGEPVPVDPGLHRVAAVRDDRSLAIEELELEEGAQREVSLFVPPATAPIAIERPHVEARIAPEPPPPGDDLTWLWATGIAVAVAAAVAITAAVVVVETSNAPEAIPGTTLPPILEWD